MSRYYWQEQGPKRSSGALFSHFLAALVGALIGGLVLITVAPTYVMDRIPAIGWSRTGDQAGTPGGPPAEEGTVIFVAETVGPAVVGVINKAIAYDIFRRPYTEQRSGSGVIFHPDGFIVTNSHVVEGAQELLVYLADGRVLTGAIVGDDPLTDLAVIKVDTTGLPHAQFGDSALLRVGELAVAIGNPVGLEFARTVTAGVISGLDRRIQQGERQFVLVQTDAAINPGNSGGPLANSSGEVIGINTLKFAAEGVEGMSFAIPINTVRPIVNELVLQGRVVRPWLGVRIVDREGAARYGVTVERGVLVVEVITGGPAAKVGLAAGDIILAINDRSVETVARLTAAVQAGRVGDEVAVVILRGGRELTLKVTLEEMHE